MIDFCKFMGNYAVRSHRTSEAVTVSHARNSEVTETLEIFTEEAVRDLHYALGRYIDLCEEERRKDNR